MKRGPKPKPSHLKIISGNPGGHGAAINISKEPKSEPASLKPPSGMTKLERVIWNREAPKLFDAGLFTKLDTAMFLMLVRNMAIVEQCTASLHTKGIFWKQGKQVIPSPALSIKRNAEAMVYRIMGDFGLSPSSRSTLNTGAMEPPVIPSGESADPSKEAAIDEAFFGKQA